MRHGACPGPGYVGAGVSDAPPGPEGLALARQVGRLYMRLPPVGIRALSAGPEIGEPIGRMVLADVRGGQLIIGGPKDEPTLAVFTAPGCRTCVEPFRLCERSLTEPGLQVHVPHAIRRSARKPGVSGQNWRWTDSCRERTRSSKTAQYLPHSIRGRPGQGWSCRWQRSGKHARAFGKLSSAA